MSFFDKAEHHSYINV